MSTYPHRNDSGDLVWACCISNIGPACAHKAQPVCLTETEKHIVGLAIRGAYFRAKSEGDDTEARHLRSAAHALGVPQYVPELSETPPADILP